MIIIATLLIGIGYASVNSVILSISGNANASLQDGIYITSVTYNNSIDADYSNSKILLAHQTLLSSNVILSENNANSSITYNVTIYNSNSYDYAYVGEEYLISEDTYSNEDIAFKLEGLNVGDILKAKNSITFKITFYYNNNTASTVNTLKSVLNFNFKRVYYVTYENFTSTSNYPTHVIEGDTLNVSFGTLDAPIEVKKNETIIDSSEYTYSNFNLTLDNINEEIHIRKLTKYIIENKITDGSFESGFNHWSLSGTPGTWGTFNTNYFGNTAAYRVASGEGQNFLRQNIYWEINHKYYFFGYGISVKPQLLACNVTNRGGKFTVTTGPDALRKGSTIYTADFTGDNTVSINYAEISDNLNVDGIGLVDLTKHFGSGNEPDIDWCNANIEFFDSTTIVYK